MRFGWVGFHLEGLPALEALLEDHVRMAAVLTLTPEAAARRCAVADYEPVCRRFNVPLYPVADINHEAAVKLLESLELDVLFVIGWSQILRRPALRSARVGVIGAHASLLPRYRGSAPVNWALIKGEQGTGNTLMWLAEDVDSGDIIDQRAFPITAYDTCATLYERVAASNRDMIRRLVPHLLAGERPGRPQPRTGDPVLPRRRPQDGQIDWGCPGQAVYNFVRALTRPYPGAFSWLDGVRWTIWHAALLPGTSDSLGPPGQVLGPLVSPVESACGLVVACGRGAVVLLELEADDGAVLAGRQLTDQPWTGRVWAS